MSDTDTQTPDEGADLRAAGLNSTPLAELASEPLRPRRQPGPKPKSIVIEENLHWQKKAGGELVLNLDIPWKMLRKASENSEDESDQFMEVLNLLGNQQTIAEIEEMGSIEVMALITTFFKEFEKLVGVALGEASGSPASSASTDEPSLTTSATSSTDSL